MNKRSNICGFFFNIVKTLLLFFALYRIYEGLDNLIFTFASNNDLISVCDIFFGVIIWLVACRIHLHLRMRRR